jgi:hypothetical protein
MKQRSNYDAHGVRRTPNVMSFRDNGEGLPMFQPNMHNYITVDERNIIGSVAFDVPLTREYLMKRFATPLNGYHFAKPELLICWSDSGSMDGSPINEPLSNMLGFTAYGPCLICRSGNEKSIGLTVEQFETVLTGLEKEPPDAKSVRAKLEDGLKALEAVPRYSADDDLFDWTTIPFELFKQNVEVTNSMYGLIRRFIPDKTAAKEYIRRVNSVRYGMRAAIDERNDDVYLTIGYDESEVDYEEPLETDTVLVDPTNLRLKGDG